MRDEWLWGLRSWASGNDSIRQLWLFGSRATGRSRADSDVDLAVSLVPPVGKHNWALGNYVARGDEWQEQLKGIVGRHVSLGTDKDAKVRRGGVLLWTRDHEALRCGSASDRR
jgi:predicted nucleotidyltransferase